MNEHLNSSPISIHVSGAAGDGIDSLGTAIAKLGTRSGLYVFGIRWYQSIIRGGISAWRARLSNSPVTSMGDYIDIFVPLSSDSVELYAKEVRAGGLILLDSKLKGIDLTRVAPQATVIRLPISETARRIAPRIRVMKNSVILGIIAYLIGYDLEKVRALLTEQFSKKGEKVVDLNLLAVQQGVELAKSSQLHFDHSLQLSDKRRMFIVGNDAFALGALAAGCTGWAQYPMTPATGILHFLASVANEKKIVVKQVEDELGVISTAIGMAFAGAKAGCATSGGGFALMTEAIGMASMLELPVVVVTSMRGGPSTGMPTKTEQGDLNQLLGASQGDFPRIILAATDVKDAYHTAVEAFNLAEKWQVPVIVALDLYLSEHYETWDHVNLEVPIYHRPHPQLEEGVAYARYKYTETGVSPRSIPGERGLVHVVGSDEHDEYGNLVSDRLAGTAFGIETRNKMHAKRMRKMKYIPQDLGKNFYEGSAEDDILIVGWGSTKGVISEAVQLLKLDGIQAGHLQIKYILPFKTDEVLPILQRAKTVLIVEENYTGQMARHIRAETGFTIEHKLLTWDTEYLKPAQIVEKVKEVLSS